MVAILDLDIAAGMYNQLVKLDLTCCNSVNIICREGKKSHHEDSTFWKTISYQRRIKEQIWGRDTNLKRSESWSRFSSRSATVQQTDNRKLFFVFFFVFFLLFCHWLAVWIHLTPTILIYCWHLCTARLALLLHELEPGVCGNASIICLHTSFDVIKEGAVNRWCIHTILFYDFCRIVEKKYAICKKQAWYRHYLFCYCTWQVGIGVRLRVGFSHGESLHCLFDFNFFLFSVPPFSEEGCQQTADYAAEEKTLQESNHSGLQNFGCGSYQYGWGTV